MSAAFSSDEWERELDEQEARVKRDLADSAARAASVQADKAAKSAAAAPDKAKLLKFADVLSDLGSPAFDDEALFDEVSDKVRALASWCAEKSASI